MSSLWQKFRNSSGGLQNVNFVTNIFNRRNYKDLDSDNVDKSVSSGEPHEDGNDESAEACDQVDAGIVRRRKYTILTREWGNNGPVSKWQWTKDDDLWRENNHNELIETKTKLDQSAETEQREEETSHSEARPSFWELNNAVDQQVGIHQTHVNEPSQKQTVDLIHKPVNSQDADTCPSGQPSSESTRDGQSVPYRRPRRDSYDKALSEMRDSYDRVFGDIIDEPTVISTGSVNAVKQSAGSSGSELDDGYGSQSSTTQDNVSRKPFRRQISSALQQEIPSAINIIRRKSYSKLGEDPNEIVDITNNEDTNPTEWHTSFPVPEKKQSRGRNRSKKAWKKTKKAARVTWKWLKRSLIAYSASHHYGVPITVAMYGGSRRQGRPKFYDYR